jgi:hypothetical protein
VYRIEDRGPSSSRLPADSYHARNGNGKIALTEHSDNVFEVLLNRGDLVGIFWIFRCHLNDPASSCKKKMMSGFGLAEAHASMRLATLNHPWSLGGSGSEK